MTSKANNSENEQIANSEDLPEAITESYGTGVKEQPGFNIGGRTMQDEMREYTDVSPELSGGDIDAAWDQADVSGEEAVGGTVATPDQDIVDELGDAVGLGMAEQEYVHTNEVLETRDARRWELDPTSSEDYQERRQ
ncbi:MAG: hypothetical protein JOZ78_23840 [Chroococcidiopsidaceae cyanobacterium CP_BM_ER_R8_30]|nr:hypothetical protein [Chroococcidiopsidaceae cyanobacterium CP_BM_ER_R8_30]